MYEKLRKSKTEPHKYMRFCWNINLKKLAIELGCSYSYLVDGLNGTKKFGFRIEKDLFEIIKKIDEDRI